MWKCSFVFWCFFIPVCEAEMLHRDRSQLVLLSELSLHLNLELIQYLCEGLIFPSSVPTNRRKCVQSKMRYDAEYAYLWIYWALTSSPRCQPSVRYADLRQCPSSERRLWEDVKGRRVWMLFLLNMNVQLAAQYSGSGHSLALCEGFCAD